MGKGGEAEIYEAGPGLVAKIYKGPDHPDFTTPQEKASAADKIAEQEQKLKNFPAGIPSGVIAPVQLLFSPKVKKFLGFTMAKVDGAELLIRYGKRQFREGVVSNQDATQILLSLYDQTLGLHNRQVVIADSNDLNVMVKGLSTFIIDADSFQYGKWVSPMYTERFLDPLQTDGRSMIMVKPHTPETDWYAYLIMLMQTLLYVGPYGGIHRPTVASKKLSQSERPLKRVTVFSPEVVYPAPATPLKVLPDTLLQFLEDVFVRDIRKLPSRDLLRLSWKKCACGQEHARNICPICAYHTPGIVTTTVRGKVTAQNIIRTSGPILFATTDFGRLQYLYHNGSSLVREPILGLFEERVVAAHTLSPNEKFRILRGDTLVAKGNTLKVLGKEVLPVDTFDNTPVYDVSSAGLFTISNGIIYQYGGMEPRRIGNVIPKRTMSWVGPRFGFGFYQVATSNDSFVFDVKGGPLKNFLNVPLPKGQLVDSTCFFVGDDAWFIFSTMENSKLMNRCILLNSKGEVLATAEGEDGDGSWLGTLRAKTAIPGSLLAVADDGLVRVQRDADKLVVAAEFPDTEPFVDNHARLLASSAGIYVVSRKQITLLSIK